MKELLTRNECTAMRGIAILAIVLHNYCHFISKIVQENEYQFFVSHNEQLWQVISHPDELLPIHLFSFFGHYGVPVFLFLSGYGLVRKYETSDDSCPPMRFVRYNYLKLLRMLIVGFSLFICVDMVTPGRFQFHWDNVIAQLLMYINVLPEPEKTIWPGIYWFFGLMMELYIVYRLLFYRRSSWIAVALIVVCWLLQAFCDPKGDTLNRLRYNCIGGMLPFGLGIIAARVRTLRTDFHTWLLWIPVFIILGTIALVKAMPKWMLSIVTWFGSISAAMFVAHPIARKLFITVAWKQDIYDGLMLYIIAVIAISWAVKQLIDRIPQPKL